jgi:hypothetical protein
MLKNVQIMEYIGNLLSGWYSMFGGVISE